MFRVKHASWFENLFSPQTSIYISTPVKICFHPKPVYIYAHQWKYVFTTNQWKSLHTSENMCTRILENIYSPVCHNIICVCVCVCVCVCAMTHSHVPWLIHMYQRGRLPVSARTCTHVFSIFWNSDHRQSFPLKSTEIWRYRKHRFCVLKIPLAKPSPLHQVAYLFPQKSH